MKKEASWPITLFSLVLALALVTGCSMSVSSDDDDDGDATPASQSDEQADGEAADGDGKPEKKRGKKDDEDEEKKEEAVPVEVFALEQGPIESLLRFSSNLEAERQVQVIAEASRLVTQLLVEEGDRVRRGQVLIRLQSDEQKSAVAKAQSQLDKAAREYERQERLYEQQLISEETFNNATYELDQLKISLADAERELSYTDVRAPIGGTITQRLVNLGDHINVGEQLFDIVDFNSIVARVYVPEKNLIQLREGLPARINAQALGGAGHDGSITRIAPIVDPRSGTVKVTVGVGNQSGLRPGMYVDVDLVTATRAEALLVPKRALVYDNDQIFVFRLGEERRVERILVEPALSDKFNIEPLDGLALGDQVVVAGQAGLKDGALVSLPGDASEAKGNADDDDAVRASN